MRKRVRVLFTLATGFVLAAGALGLGLATLALAEQPPAGGQSTFTGPKRCAACHFKEYTNWKKTNHSKAYTTMAKEAPKYAADAACLKCHITGYGVPGGYQGAATPDLVGVTCEACHGPGSTHEDIAKKYTNVKTLSAEQKKEINAPIVRKTDNCGTCHLTVAHGEHPKYEGMKEHK